jgi:hypothetical protein
MVGIFGEVKGKKRSKKPSITPSFRAEYTNTGKARLYGAGNPTNCQIF